VEDDDDEEEEEEEEEEEDEEAEAEAEESGTEDVSTTISCTALSEGIDEGFRHAAESGIIRPLSTRRPTTCLSDVMLKRAERRAPNSDEDMPSTSNKDFCTPFRVTCTILDSLSLLISPNTLFPLLCAITRKIAHKRATE